MEVVRKTVPSSGSGVTKAGRAPPERRRGAHLRVKAVEPVGGWTTESVTHGQCDARPTVTFLAAERRRPLAGTKLYCLVTEAHGCELAQSCYSVADWPGVELATFRSRANALPTEPPSHPSGLAVSALGIRTRRPGFDSRVVPLFHWAATLGKII